MKFIATVFLLMFSSVTFSASLDDARLAMQRGDFETAVEILTPLADSGDVDALGNLGNLYAFGQGVPKDMEIAYSYWLKASDKHLGSAMFNIATVHLKGLGNYPKDTPEGISWLERAAEHRHFQGMLAMSALLHSGQGIERDDITALAWAGIAASNAPSDEYKNMAEGQLRKIMNGMNRDQVTLAQNKIKELTKVIDSNVRKYKQH